MPQPRNAEPPAEPEPTTPPAAETDEPEWARRLRETVESLPAKLRATISDEDRKSIAEGVHGLFERSGAFHREEPEHPEGEEPEHPEGDPPPEKKSLAERLGFPKY